MKENTDINIFINYLEKENIIIDFNEFEFQAKSHPEYPSLLAFHDTLSFFNIDNTVIKVPIERVHDLPTYFIAEIAVNNINSNLVLVVKKGNNYFIKEKNLNDEIPEKEFYNAWTGVVLIAEKNENFNFIKKNTKSNFWNVLIIISLLFVLGIVISFFSTKLVFIELLAALGVYFAIEAIKEEFNITTAFSSVFCNLTENTSCSSVIKSQKFKFIKNFGLSDISIVFFVGQLLLLLLFVVSGFYEQFFSLITAILILSIPITFVSIYYQWLIIKKWCPICLGIIGVLFLEITAIYFLNQGFNFSNLNFLTITLLIFSYSLPLIGWIILKKILKKYINLKSERINLIRFKRNYKLFSYALKDSKKIDYATLKSDISVGNPIARLKISIITSPLCGYCVDAHNLLQELLSKFPNDILINIRFNLNPEDSNEQVKSLHVRLVEIFFEKGQEAFLNALDSWFKNKNLDTWFSEFGTNKDNAKIESILTIQFNKNKQNELLFTPALIVGEYLYPNLYDRESLKYFIDDLLEDSQFFIS